MVVAPPKLLTYEEYLAEGEIRERYDIINGERIVMPNPTEDHQDIAFNIATPLKTYGQRTGRGKMVIAPQDVLITRRPLRVRQPDVLFISAERKAQNRPSSDPAPWSPAPELVVEILSPSDTRSVLEDKIADYVSVNVLELWAVRQGAQTVEVLRLSPLGAVSEAIYGRGETVQSLTFPDLTVSVDSIFAE